GTHRSSRAHVRFLLSRRASHYCTAPVCRYNSMPGARSDFLGGAKQMWLDPKRYEIMDEAMSDIIRAKTPDERLAIAESLWRMAPPPPPGPPRPRVPRVCRRG